MTDFVSPYFLNRCRSEPEVRAAQRQAKLRADLIAEGASQDMIDRLATRENAQRMVEYEDKVQDMILGLFEVKP